MTLALQPDFKTLSHRNELPAWLTARGLTGKFVEVGTLFGAYAGEILARWPGRLYCVDPWRNQAQEVYFDGANTHDMENVFRQASAGVGQNPRCTMLRMLSLHAVGRFEDGELDGVYDDGNHAVDSVRADLAAWWPKIKIGGVLCGHDLFTRYDKDTNSDALTAVMEFAEAIGVRPHATWCTSWYFIKTAEADARFRKACLDRRIGQPVYSENETCPLVVVLAVAKFDWHLAKKWLQWVGDSFPLDAGFVLLVSPDVPAERREEIEKLMPPQGICEVPDIEELGYFGSPNQMIKAALDLCAKQYPGAAMLWCEADTVPMYDDWVQKIHDEFRTCGRPFLGDMQREGPIVHLSGNAVYHPDWRKFAPSLAALGKEQCGWDTLCAHDIVPRAHQSKTIQQVWRPPAITEAWATANIRTETALFHQCKDGTLIDVLCDRMPTGRFPLDPPLCDSTYDRDRRLLVGQVGPLGAIGPDRGFVVFTPHDPKVAIMNRPRGPVTNVEILIVTCRRDVEFLKYCLRFIEKNARGFTGVMVVIPEHEAEHFKWITKANVRTFKECEGKGMLHHEVQICRADEWCPNADAILHMDADCMMWLPTTPDSFAPNGYPQIVRERYDDCGRRNPNRLLWQTTTRLALGFTPEFETMVRHPNIHLRPVYARTRELIEANTGQPFDQFVLSGRNEFPQTFAEFPALGAVAIRFYEGAYCFFDYDHDADEKEFKISQAFQYLYRKDRDKVVELWSHHGIEHYRSDLEAFLNYRIPAYFIK